MAFTGVIQIQPMLRLNKFWRDYATLTAQNHSNTTNVKVKREHLIL